MSRSRKTWASWCPCEYHGRRRHHWRRHYGREHGLSPREARLPQRGRPRERRDVRTRFHRRERGRRTLPVLDGSEYRAVQVEYRYDGALRRRDGSSGGVATLRVFVLARLGRRLAAVREQCRITESAWRA